MTTTRTEKAVTLFEEGWTCSQAILAAFGECIELDWDTAVLLGRGYSGGISRMGRTCGAVTGAILIVNCVADGAPDEATARTRVTEAGRDLVRRFEERFGTIDCKGLLGVDISTEEGYRAFQEQKMCPDVCRDFVGAAAAMVEDLI